MDDDDWAMRAWERMMVLRGVFIGMVPGAVLGAGVVMIWLARGFMEACL